jgi:3D (Asp-Asp-Asp) domain-containing protein
VNKKAKYIWNQIKTSPEFKITAYDLSVQSCGKKFTDRSYGITRSGISLKGHDLRSASTISTDPRIIPLGSIVYIYFNNEEAQEYNGLYLAQDTGSKIKGNKIDLFFGDKNSEKPSIEALNFGIQQAKVVKVE